MLQIPLRKLAQLKPQPTDLDRYELASTDDLRAWQRDRLAWSLRHAYDNVPHYRAEFDAAGVHPDDFKTLSDLAKFPFTAKADLRDNYPFGMFAVPQSAGRAHPCLLRHHRQADRGRLHQGRHRCLERPGRPLDPRRRARARHEGARRLWLRPVHRRPRRALRCRAARLHGDPDVAAA